MPRMWWKDKRIIFPQSFSQNLFKEGHDKLCQEKKKHHTEVTIIFHYSITLSPVISMTLLSMYDASMRQKCLPSFAQRFQRKSNFFILNSQPPFEMLKSQLKAFFLYQKRREKHFKVFSLKKKMLKTFISCSGTVSQECLLLCPYCPEWQVTPAIMPSFDRQF